MFSFIKQIKDRIQKYRETARQSQAEKKKKKMEHITKTVGTSHTTTIGNRTKMFRKRRRLNEIGTQSRLANQRML